MDKSSFQDIIKQNGYLIYPFKGVSMLPMLKEGEDVVRIEEMDEYQIYDVILFTNKKKEYVLHRLIDINNDLYKAKGDNAINVEIIKKEDIIGKLVGYYHLDKYISINDPSYQEYLDKYIINKKYNKKKRIYSYNLELSSFKVNEKIKRAYYSLFIYAVNKESFDISPIKELTKEDFKELVKLCLLKKSDHILASILKEYELIDIDEHIHTKLMKNYEINKSRYLFHDYYIKDIASLLTKNNINHIFLKGSYLRSRYINPLLRASSDIDIYIDKKDIPQVVELIKSQYYVDEYKVESVHHMLSIYKGKALIELHYALFEDDFKLISSILDNPFNHASIVEGNTYRLDEDYYYLYHLAHFAKHMKKGECWMNMMMDSYLYKDYSNADELLIKANLFNFKLVVNKVIDYWCNKITSNNAINSFEEIYFSDALFNYVLTNKKNHKTKLGYILSRIFISKSQLTESYPKMKNRWYLYPIYFFKRLFTTLFSKRIKKPLKELDTFGAVSKDKLEDLYLSIGLANI